MFFYIIYVLLSPVVWIVTHVAGIFNRKIRTRLQQQAKSRRVAFKHVEKNKGSKRLILFHAASAGEFEQLKPVLRRMDREKYFILQTFYSPTIFEKEKESEYFDAVCYQPFDFPWSASRFFKQFNPTIYVITRHDIWPNHVYFAQKRGIETYLINANLYEGSARLKWFSMGFNRWLFGKFNLILTGSERLRTQLSKLVPADRIEVTGDTRFDRITERKAMNKGNHFPKEIFDTDNIILGSIIESDYEVVFGGIEKQYPGGDESLKQSGHRLIIVSHEVDEKTLSDIETRCRKRGLTIQRYSSIADNLTAQTVLVDTVGILADLYAYAKLAYVGAGFGAGVHSVIEPAVYGCAISFGPKIRILDEAVSLHKTGIGSMVHSVVEFEKFLSILSKTKTEKLNTLKRRTLRFVRDSEGASERVLTAILE